MVGVQLFPSGFGSRRPYAFHSMQESLTSVHAATTKAGEKYDYNPLLLFPIAFVDMVCARKEC